MCNKGIYIKDTNIFGFLLEYMKEKDIIGFNKIKGAKEEKITEFKKISKYYDYGYEFPQIYEDFLRIMGEDDGGLFSETYEGTSSVQELIDHYNSYGEDLHDDFEMEYNQLIFLINMLEAQYYITCDEKGKYFITTSFDDEYHVDGFSESFEKLLFQTVFIKYEKEKFKDIIYFGTNRMRLEKKLHEHNTNRILEVIESLVEKKGFEKVWFSDKWSYIGIKEGMVLYVHEGFAAAGYIMGGDLLQQQQIVDELCELLDFKIQ